MPTIGKGETEEERYKRLSRNNGPLWLNSSDAIDEYYGYNKKEPKKKSSKKDKLKKEIEDALALVKSIKIPKKSKHDDVTKHLKAVTKAQMIKEIEDTIKKVEGVNMTPKGKSTKYKKDIDDVLAKVDTLLSKPKKEKAMKKTDYKHVAKKASDKVMDYVHEFIYILDSGKTKASITKACNKLRSKFMETARASEVSDANAMIREYREANVKKEEPKTKVKAVKADASDYDKKYKQCATYLKAQIKKGEFPELKDEENFMYVCKEAVSKGFKSMSKKFVKEIQEQ